MDRSSQHSNSNNNSKADGGSTTVVVAASTPSADRTTTVTTPTRPPSTESTASTAKTTERSAIVLALFGPSVGPCLGDFSTTYNRVNGRLYAATHAILFYSNLFGFERRLCLAFSDIESIEAYRSTSIRISMVDCEDHVFRKFLNREQVLQVLKELYQKAVGSGNDSMVGNMAMALTMDADSTPIRRARNNTEDETETSMEDSMRDRLASELSQPEAINGNESEVLRPRSQSVPSMQALLAVQERNKLDVSMRPRIFRRSLSTMSGKGVPAIVQPPPVIETVHSDSAMESGLSPSVEASNPVPAGFDMNEAWSVAKQPYSEVAVENTTIHCSLAAFMDMFLSNEASFPISRYQTERIMDKNVSYSKWTRREAADIYPPIFDRSISFIHPLNNSVGPSQAKTNRQQSFQRFGTLGATLQNTTFIQGVPGAECFRVEDRWVIESIDDNEGSVRISVYFQIVFSKRTIFKSIIQKNVKAETKKWYVGYAKFLRRALHEDDKKEDNNESPPSPLGVSDSETEPISGEEEEEQDNKKLFWSSRTMVWSLFVLLCVMALQIVNLQRSMYIMHSQLTALQQQNQELTAMMKQLVESDKC